MMFLLTFIWKQEGQTGRCTKAQHLKIRHSLNRYINSPLYNRGIDIIKDDVFRDANMNFRAAMAELNRKGIGVIDHHPVVHDADIAKLYMSPYLNINTPTGLMQNVQFDVRLYFFRRGGENMSRMTKATFVTKNDPDSGLRYVCKQMDELSKNHRENDKEKSSGVMPEIQGSAFCPVMSFEKYIQKLHPDLDRLWQRPLDSFTDDDTIWYCKTPIGDKSLSKFMSDLSVKCELSKKYTNHSIRATGATVLSKSQFGAAQIMSVTRHKSVSSLSVYQRVSDSEKMRMGQSLAMHVTGKDSALALPAPKTLPALPVPTSTHSCSIPKPTALPLPEPAHSDLNYLQDIDLNELLNEFHPQTAVQQRSTAMQENA